MNWNIKGIFVKPESCEGKLDKKFFKLEEIETAWAKEEEYLKTRPIRRYWRNVLRPFLYNLPDMPRDIYRAIKRGIQRGYRGWADEDVWKLNSYLALVIKESVKNLRDNHLGYPSGKEIKDEKDWDKVLDKICYTFDLLEQMSNGKAIYLDSKTLKRKSLLGIYKPADYKIITKEEYKAYLEGWNLFRKYYLSLWD